MRHLFGVIVLASALVRIGHADDQVLPTSLEGIQDAYRAVQRDLVRRDGGKPRDKDAPETKLLLDRAWPLIGAWAAAYLHDHPATTAAQLAARLPDLNPPAPPADPGEDSFDEFWEELEGYRIRATGYALPTGETHTYALAVTYAWWGRLVIVTPDGVATSAEIHRRGTFHPLPNTRAGHHRFYVDARSDDWPTSLCRGGQVGIWEWDGRAAVPLLVREYSDMGPGPGWGVHLRNDWLEVHTHNELKTFSDGCGGSTLKALRRIHVTPHGVEDTGLRYEVPELPLIDTLLYRSLHHESVADVATPDAADAVAKALAQGERLPDASDYLGMIGWWHATRRPKETEFFFSTDGSPFLELVFTIAERAGRPFIVAATAPDHVYYPLLRDVEFKLQTLRLNPHDRAARERALDLVAVEHPDRAIDLEVRRRVIADGAPGKTSSSAAGRP